MYEPGSFCSSKRVELVVGLPFSKYPICFSIQTSQNSASSITFIVTSSSPKSLLLVQQHIDGEQLSLCAFPVLKLSKSAVKNAAPAKADGSNEVTPTHPPVPPQLLPAQISWATPKANYPTKNLFISMDQGSQFTLKLHNPLM